MTKTVPSGTAAPERSTGAPRVLKRSIGVPGATMLTLTCVTPASSLFVLVPGLFGEMGTGAALGILVAAVICFAVALCYCELGTLVPSSGGEYAIVDTVVGRFAGWMVFAFAMMIVLFFPAIMAVGVSAYLRPVLDLSPTVAGALVLCLATAMGLLNLRSNAWITGTFLVLEVVAAGVVAFLGFGNTKRGPELFFRPETIDRDGGLVTVELVTIVGGLAIALFVLQGFSTAVYLSEEVRDPRRTIARTVLWTLVFGTVIILVPVIALTMGAPDVGTLTAGNISGLAAAWSSPGVGAFVSLGIAGAIVNAVVVMVIQGARVLYSSGRDRAWPQPVNRALSTVSARTGSPWAATLIVGAPGAALCFVPVETLSGVTSVVVVLLYLAVAVASLRTRGRRFRSASAWRMPVWPVAPIVVLLALIYVLVQQAVTDLIVVAAVALVAALHWAGYVRRRPGERWLISVPSE